MINRLAILFVLLTPVTLVFGQDTDVKSYFPLEVGDTWEYEHTWQSWDNYLAGNDVRSLRRYYYVHAKSDTLIDGQRHIVIDSIEYDAGLNERDRRTCAMGMEPDGTQSGPPFSSDPLVCGWNESWEYYPPWPIIHTNTDGEITGWFLGDAAPDTISISGDLVFPDDVWQQRRGGGNPEYYNNYLRNIGLYQIERIAPPQGMSSGEVQATSLIYAFVGGVQFGVTATHVENADLLPGRESLSLSTWPNPFSSQLSIRSSTSRPGPLHYLVTDVTGRTILAGKVEAGNPLELDTGSLSSGIYVVAIIDSQGRRNSKLITKLQN